MRVLDLAERVTTLVEAKVWTRTNFPARNAAARRLRAEPCEVAASFRLLVERGVLRFYLDRDISARPRHFPAEGAEQYAFDLNYLITTIRNNIVSEVWTVDNFPTLAQLASYFRCRRTMVTAALKELESVGVVRRVKVMRTWRWVPMTHPEFCRPALQHKLADDIRAGAWTGPLPDVTGLARHYHVHRAKMTAALRMLERLDLVRHVWLPDFTRRAWYVMDTNAPQWFAPVTGAKMAAIAADLLRRLPEWIHLGLDGAVIDRRPLPPITVLRQHYHCHHAVMKKALTALVLRGVLECVDGLSPTYVPLRIPPRGFPEGIPAASRRAGVARRRRPFGAVSCSPDPAAAKVS